VDSGVNMGARTRRLRRSAVLGVRWQSPDCAEDGDSGYPAA